MAWVVLSPDWHEPPGCALEPPECCGVKWPPGGPFTGAGKQCPGGLLALGPAAPVGLGRCCCDWDVLSETPVSRIPGTNRET